MPEESCAKAGGNCKCASKKAPFAMPRVARTSPENKASPSTMSAVGAPRSMARACAGVSEYKRSCVEGMAQENFAAARSSSRATVSSSLKGHSPKDSDSPARRIKTAICVRIRLRSCAGVRDPPVGGDLKVTGSSFAPAGRS